MSPEETLIEARRRYPVGTKFISPHSGDTYQIDEDNLRIENSHIRCRVQNGSYDPYIYYNDKWGEILSLPEPQVINTYQIF